MNNKKWSKIALTLFLGAFSFSSHAVDYYDPCYFNQYYDTSYSDSETMSPQSQETDFSVKSCEILYDRMDIPFETRPILYDSKDAPNDSAEGPQYGKLYGIPELLILSDKKCRANKKNIVLNENLSPYDPAGVYLFGLEYAKGKYIAIDQDYGGVSFFSVPKASFKSIHMLFDIGGYKLENRNWAARAGLGFRAVDRRHNLVYGLNTYYDHLDQRSNSYNQVGLGFEILNKCWELHINGYLPVRKTRYQLSERVQNFDDGFQAILRENQFALRGFELTGGGRLNFCRDLHLYLASGYYLYNNKDIGNIHGLQCCAEIGWNNWVVLKVNASYDSVFKRRVQGVLAVNIPFNFGCVNTCSCCTSDLLGRPVRRNDLIFLKKCCSIEKNWDDDNGLLLQ